MLFTSDMKNRLSGFTHKLFSFIELIISMAGFVPRHATTPRIIAFAASILFSLYVSEYQPDNVSLAFFYFALSELLYIGFISVVLSKNGLRLWFVKKWGDEGGYLVFEAILGILFFHNALSIGYVASATSDGFSFDINRYVFLILIGIPFIAGFIIKILAAKAVSVDIYYWKDMFLGRKICDFVVTGPYKYFSNPMYGVGQMQAYAAALWYVSGYGLLAAFLNQALIFTFYYMSEKKFISRVYLNDPGLQIEIIPGK